MSTMSALSMLQEAQTARNIAAFQALANMRHEHDELRNSSAMSPPSLVGASLQNEPANFYANLFGGSHHLGLLTPQMIAANQFNTAALLSKLYPHPLLSWQMPPLGTAASPPISPTSPISVKNLKKLNNNNNIVSTTTNEEFINNNYKLNLADDLIKHDETNTYTSIAQSPTTGKKTAANRKSINYRKKRTTSLFQPYAKLEPASPLNSEMAVSPGPISPPTSGSSPQSIGSIEHQSPSSSSVAAKETSTRDKTFTCQTCNRSFGYKHVLQNHERTHTGEKPYACPICSKRFTRDHHLKTHMRLHTGEKPYSCDFCDRQFVQVANLRRHLRVHTGEKPYTCPICSSKFSDSNQLKAHSIVHQDEKPYCCQTCDASFRHSHHLVNHKCAATLNNNSPLTPAMSPVMSMDTKSIASRSDVSQDDLLDLSTQSAALIKNLTLNFNHYKQSHNGNSNNNNNNNNNNNHNKSTSNMLSPTTIKQERYEHQANDNHNDYSDAQDMPLDLSIDSSNSDNGKNRSDSV